MAGREMEGDNRYRRKRARAERRKQGTASKASATLGASKQRHHLPDGVDHKTKLGTIRAGKQRVIRENSPEPRPRSRGRS